jgi:xylulokinase
MTFLGIDIGTGGSRAVLIDELGRVVAAASVEHAAVAAPHMGWAEQEPQDWWQASAAAIRRVTETAGVRADSIAAVGFSGQMHGSVFLDEADEVIRPALLWYDQRTEKQCIDITERIGQARLIELVCNPAITGFTLPKLLWLRDVEPENWRRVRTILLPKDYVRLRISGDKASDVNDSSGTLLFDVQNRTWSSEILDTLELDASLLPHVYESIEVTGTVSKSGADATGLIEGTLVIAGAGDNAAGAVGMGIVKPGPVGVTIGTSGVVFVVTEKPTLDLAGRVHTLCHAVPDRWQVTGVTLSAGESLKWFRDKFGGGKSFADLDREAAAVDIGSDGAIWLPYLMGERSPHLDPNARAAFVGLTANHTASHLTRAVMEGVAFSLRDCLEIMQSLGSSIETIRLGGGGSKSPLWCQIQADVYRRTVETITVDEGAAFGAALLAGVGAGAWSSVDDACAQAIKVAKRIQPNSESADILDRNFETYLKLYPMLKSSFGN